MDSGSGVSVEQSLDTHEANASDMEHNKGQAIGSEAVAIEIMQVEMIQDLLDRLDKNTANECFDQNRTGALKFNLDAPQGLVLHSVGGPSGKAPQPNAQSHVNNFNKPKSNPVQAFLQEDGTIIQCLPWSFTGWHMKGPLNRTHIGVEMTEPATIVYNASSGSKWHYKDDAPKTKTATKNFVLGTYKTAVVLFAFLCNLYNIDPEGEMPLTVHPIDKENGISGVDTVMVRQLTSHQEAAQLGDQYCKNELVKCSMTSGNGISTYCVSRCAKYRDHNGIKDFCQKRLQDKCGEANKTRCVHREYVCGKKLPNLESCGYKVTRNCGTSFTSLKDESCPVRFTKSTYNNKNCVGGVHSDPVHLWEGIDIGPPSKGETYQVRLNMNGFRSEVKKMKEVLKLYFVVELPHTWDADITLGKKLGPKGSGLSNENYRVDPATGKMTTPNPRKRENPQYCLGYLVAYNDLSSALKAAKIATEAEKSKAIASGSATYKRYAVFNIQGGQVTETALSVEEATLDKKSKVIGSPSDIKSFAVKPSFLRWGFPSQTDS